MGFETIMDVGIRELRNSLSRHLDEVRAGETITVTDRGRAIARIVPIEHPDALEQLIRSGRVTPAKKHKGPLAPPMRVNGTVSDLVLEERRAQGDR